ncbi:uncharacterized protein LOC129949150 [Eupeodes corollae]|uniref:uncharacterized protein LOC129949150 n=1 Tax=Eupeodes corollae TaxID=290404 RepID=UPI002491CEB4|nr:uncharacterized protein LOC129949150 [Eupeodes corollae]
MEKSYKYGELQKGLLTKVIKDLTNFKKAPKERRTPAYASGRLSKLEEDLATSKAYHEAIIGGGMLEEYLKKDELLVVYDQMYDIYLEYRAELVEAMEKSKTLIAGDVLMGAPPPHSSASSSHSAIRLPRIDLPKFDGSYTNWRAFHDRFQALVHKNATLEDIDKLHFLQTCLIGDAHRFMQNIAVESASYEKAWELLEERYNHKRILVHIQMQSLFGQPSLTRETASGLKELLYTTRECLLALENLEVPISSWDTVLIWFLVQKLPSTSQKLWEEKLGNSKDLPKFDAFSEFLETRFRTLEVMGQQELATPTRRKEESSVNSRPRFQPSTSKVLHTKHVVKHQPQKIPKHFQTSQVLCKLCNHNKHSLRKCQQFLAMDSVKRREVVRGIHVCENCLTYGHSLQECQSLSRCYFCQQKHHSLLHLQHHNNSFQPQQPGSEHQTQVGTSSQGMPSQPRVTGSSSNTFQASVNPNAPEFQPAVRQQTQNYHASHGDRAQTHQVLLATAVVKARATDGRIRLLRALVDTGSETSFITEAAARLLKLERRRAIVEVSGLGLVSSGTTQHTVEVHFASRHSTFETATQALVFKSLTGHLPAQRVVPNSWNHLKGLTLADPHLYEPAPIDLLFGSDVCAQIMLPEIRRSPDNNAPIAQNTHLGWIVLGKVPEELPRQIRSFVQVTDLGIQLQKFWEMEETPFQTHETLDNIVCEEHFERNTTRLPDGRYQVSLPFKEGLPAMGSSRQGATRRFLHLEKRLAADPKLCEDYSKCRNEYIKLKHMEEIDEDDTVLATPYHYFLPHHAVFKEASSTTKLRVVFDAASKASDGKSLNEHLLVGPKLQTNIIDLVLRWRTHRVTFTADIEKMYRQIMVSFPDRYFQLILWREQKSSPIKVFKMNTVTFGTASAPYLAIKVLKKLADDESQNFPEGAKVVREDMYVDDLISGADSIEEAKRKQHEAKQLLASAGFNLRKWTSNSKALLEDIAAEDRELDFELPFNTSNHVKTLGIKWFPLDDYFSFQNLQVSPEDITKRSMLSTIAKLFDPLGWISPCIITAKLMMQRLWEHGCDWDDPIPTPLKTEWEAFQRELPLIERLRIPRWIAKSPSNKAVQLHGFCDASMKAFGAVVYIRVLDTDDRILTSLLLSKTKVAPSQRTITLPRLELCGAVLLSQLLSYTKDILAIPDVDIYAWTDLMIALAWIQASPAKWTTFVSNRVSEIQRLIQIDSWGHVATLHNPADLAIRGVFPAELESLDMWWNGPEFLTRQWEFDAPHQLIDNDTEEEKKDKSKVNVLSINITHGDKILQAIHDSSRLLKLLRVVATCRRFTIKCRPKLGPITGPINPKELDAAHQIVVKAAQKEMFGDEIQQILGNAKIPKNLLSLNAFLDSDGILRVGGRLANSLLSYDAQHPILLQSNHHFTSLVVRDAHKQTLHGGIQQMINYIRQRYWIGQIRRSVKHQLHKCPSCYRQKASEMQQLMGNLPAARVRISRPFSHTGVDYAGPIEIKAWKARGAKILKGYFAVFICLATKAIHLEAVSDLTTQAFLAAFKRFTARRGICKQIYSDCGTNFIGANNELAKMMKEAQHDWKQVAELLANRGTDWHFIPPASPHFGGLWEAGVKSVKYHLKRVIGIERLTFEELATLLAQVEACLNSRPLCPLTDSIDDLNALTPAHFLVGESLHAVPQGETETNITHKDRWKRVQALSEVFWRRWNSEYLSRLQQRPKWTKIQEKPKIGDLVLLKDERLPPTHWNMARIEQTHSGSDGLVRVVTLRTKSGQFKRPITKICLLPSNKTTEQTSLI